METQYQYSTSYQFSDVITAKINDVCDIDNILKHMHVDETQIPLNMQQIYTISNKNRRKNKSKVSVPEVPQKEKPTKDIHKFLKEIGWEI